MFMIRTERLQIISRCYFLLKMISIKQTVYHRLFNINVSCKGLGYI